MTLGPGGVGRDPAALADLAVLAEKSGWDGFLLEDYVDYRGLPTYDTWVCLAAVAAATQRLRLGTTVTPLPRRRPWELAMQTVSVDHLSGGRLILGIGSGADDDPGIVAVGAAMDARTRSAQLDEGLRVLTALWKGRPVHHHGAHYRIDGLRLPARPVQRPRIPIWVGGDLSRPGVRRRLGQWDGACVYRERALDPDDVHDIATLVTAARGDLVGYDIKVSGHPELVNDFEQAGATWWGEWIPPGEPAAARATIGAGPPGA